MPVSPTVNKNASGIKNCSRQPKGLEHARSWRNLGNSFQETANDKEEEKKKSCPRVWLDLGCRRCRCPLVGACPHGQNRLGACGFRRRAILRFSRSGRFAWPIYGCSSGRFSGLFSLSHSFADFRCRCSLRCGGCKRLRSANSLVRSCLLIELVDLGLGDETLILQTNFSAPFMAVPQDEKQNCESLSAHGTHGSQVLALTGQGQRPENIHAQDGREASA